MGKEKKVQRQATSSVARCNGEQSDVSSGSYEVESSFAEPHPSGRDVGFTSVESREGLEHGCHMPLLVSERL